MTTRLDLVRARRAAIKEAVARRKGLSVAVFGSVARGEETPDSDIDFLVEFTRDVSLLDIGGLQVDLSELLGMKVDVISTRGLRKTDDEIRKEAIAL